jgi:HEAT repeat protein
LKARGEWGIKYPMHADPLPTLLQLLREGKQDYNSRPLRKAFVVLVGKRAVDPLIQLLDHPSESVKWTTCEVLGALWDRRAVAPIAARFDQFGGTGPWALGNLGGRQASDTLLRRLESRDRFQIDCLRALGNLREKRAISLLIRLLPEGHGHSFASEGIGELDIGDNAATSLGKIGKPAGDALVAALAHRDAFVRERAANALVEVKNPKATPFLLKQLNDEPLPACAAAWALGALKEKRAIPILLRWLERPKASDFPRTAVHCLGTIGDPSVFSVLAELAEGKDAELASSAINALGGLRCEESFRLLARCPRDRVLQAYYALGAQKDPRAFALLTERLKYSDNEEAGSLAVALEELGDSRAVPLLMKRSAVSRPPLNLDIFPSVARLGTIGIKTIGALVTSTDMSEKIYAIEALGESRSLEAQSYLKPLLTENDSEIVPWVISALYEIYFSHRKTGP